MWQPEGPHAMHKILVHDLEQQKNGAPLRLVRNGSASDGVNAWHRLHMEYAPITSATLQGYTAVISQNEEHSRTRSGSSISFPISLSRSRSHV